MASINMHSVELTLGTGEDEQTLSLVPTLRAINALNTKFGSLVDAAQRVSRLDFTALVQVVAIGSGVDDKTVKRLPDLIFEAGLTAVMGPASEYMVILMNGGRRPDEGQPGEGDAGNA